MFRRRRLPERLRDAEIAFSAVLHEVEPAKAALTQCMPSTRLPGRPLPDALAEYGEHLERAMVLMPAWRRPETDQVWIACDAGLQDALARARRLREDAPTLGGFEGLLGTIEGLMDPLDPFEAAARRFRDLRV
jgi:hypothetical protein